VDVSAGGVFVPTGQFRDGGDEIGVPVRIVDGEVGVEHPQVDGEHEGRVGSDMHAAGRLVNRLDDDGGRQSRNELLPEDAVDIDQLLTNMSVYWFTRSGASAAKRDHSPGFVYHHEDRAHAAALPRTNAPSSSEPGPSSAETAPRIVVWFHHAADPVCTLGIASRVHR
jgi:hypothetical protein